MEIHQLRTFLAVAREGSITRASERVHLSQPAVSAHVKAIEDELGLVLFERTSRGMSLTRDGQQLLPAAERALAAHHELMVEAARMKGRPAGRVRVGAASNSGDVVATLIAKVLGRCPELEVVLEHGTSLEVLTGVRGGDLDAGFYNEAGEPDPELETLEVSRFGIHVVAPPGLVDASRPLDWRSLAELPWIHPASSACCGRAAESLFRANQVRPARIVTVDREDVTRTLVARGVGIGLLHAETAMEARARGEVDLLLESRAVGRVLLALLARRAREPMLAALTSIVRASALTPTPA